MLSGRCPALKNYIFKNTPFSKAEHNLSVFFAWLVLSVTVGIVIGLVGTVFGLVLQWVNTMRGEYPWLLLCLPAAGVLIVRIYMLGGTKTSGGTNLIIRSVRSEADSPFTLAPLIFISTALTHLCGGSAGREGAALQLGGSISGAIGRKLHLEPLRQSEIVMCGMAAAFAALFGTPMTAAIFALELSAVGVMRYGALIPCTLSAVTASMISSYFGIKAEVFPLSPIDLDPLNSLRVVLLGALCAVVAIIFCVVMHKVEHMAEHYLPNPYLRAVFGGIMIIAMTYILGTRNYLGAGMNIIEYAIVEGEAGYIDFIIKLLFTAVTLGCGFKGGEIVPAFFVGATFGCVVGPFIGIDAGFAAAIGLICVFCAVTNCPIASLVLSFEMFSFTSPALFMLAVGTSYALSGYYSLYSSQEFKFDKMSPAPVEEHGH